MISVIEFCLTIVHRINTCTCNYGAAMIIQDYRISCKNIWGTLPETEGNLRTAEEDFWLEES